MVIKKNELSNIRGKMKIYHYDAFSNTPNMGNPAGVVFKSDKLSVNEMQKIALKVGFNETVFIKSSEKADVRLQYFTPGHEMDLCGHATMASIFALKDRGFIETINKIETRAGVLDVRIHGEKDDTRIVMKQNPAEFKGFNGDRDKLSKALGIEENELSDDLPIVYGSTGIWTLIVPVKKLESVKRMKPDNRKFPSILKENNKASIHPFTLETIREADMHGRHFSSPYSGTIEDPVTGTASGVMGAYYLKYIEKIKSKKLKVEQGQEVGKDGLVHVNVNYKDGRYDVEIEGAAVFVKEMEI